MLSLEGFQVVDVTRTAGRDFHEDQVLPPDGINRQVAKHADALKPAGEIRRQQIPVSANGVVQPIGPHAELVCDLI
jgi:hypothetical protein